MSRVLNLILVCLFVAAASALNAERKQKLMEASPSRSGRIMGGSAAAPGQFPHQVSLQTLANFHFCGGSILNNYFILTAAHCTYQEQSDNLLVAVGSNLLTETKKFTVVQYIEHPEYDDNTLSNDVSLVQTNDRITFNDNIYPIPLVNRFVSNGNLRASGWGRVSPSGVLPNELRWIETKVVPLAECARQVPEINLDTFCVFDTRSAGVCNGDSGGPLILPGEGQVGIASFVIGTCGAGFPDGFASVYYHRNWIIENSVMPNP